MLERLSRVVVGFRFFTVKDVWYAGYALFSKYNNDSGSHSLHFFSCPYILSLSAETLLRFFRANNL